MSFIIAIILTIPSIVLCSALFALAKLISSAPFVLRQLHSWYSLCGICCRVLLIMN